MKNILAMLIAAAMVFSFVSPASADLNDGLVAYYPFNGNANDESGNGNDGTVYGATLAEDRFGDADSAYSFDGTNDYVVVGDTTTFKFLHGALDPPGFKLTVSMWVKFDNPESSTIYGLLATGSWDSSKIGFEIDYDDRDGILNRAWGVGISRGVGGTNVCSLGTGDDGYPDDTAWHHLVITYNHSLASGNAKLYQDGVNVKTGDKSGNAPSTADSSYALHIGSLGNATYSFNGSIDDIRIYDRALSESEIQELYNEGTSVEFSDFTLSKAKVKFKHNPDRDKFEVRGEFTLGLNTDGIDPVTEDVVLTVGSFSATIPAGSFVEDKDKFEFEGVVNGGDVEMEIEGVSTDTFEFKLKAKDTDLTGTANPLDIELAIGDDRGTADVRLEGTLSY